RVVDYGFYVLKWAGVVAGFGHHPVPAPPVAVHAQLRIDCTDVQLQEIARIVGRPVSAEEVGSTVKQTIASAIGLSRAAAVAVVGKQARLFKAVFGLSPGWHPTGVSWRVGGVVRKRFELAARLLASGSLRFSCFGWSSLPPADDTPEKYYIRAIGDKYRIGLGRRFWESVRDNDPESAEAALMAAALRVAFGQLIRFTKDAKTKNRAYCYLRYALFSAGRKIPIWLGSGCPVPPDRWNRLMPSPGPTAAPPAVPPSSPAAPTAPPRLRLTDEELERILGIKPADPLAAHIDWMISQVPPTAAARPTLGDLLKRKLDAAVDRASERLGVPSRLRKYVRQAAQGAAKTGAKLVVEEGLRKMGLDSKEAIEAVWATVERVAKETP
ncbi:MAG: hypothetical protein ACT4O2_06615, partial [Beijerinckiaceae bacterium]